MKTFGIYKLLGVVLVLSLFSFQEWNPNLKKRITDTRYRYEFYVTSNEPDVRKDRTYYWFKGGTIHTSENGISGELLHDKFEKFYLNNQLAEKGEFSRGLKVGMWKTWHANGVLESTQYWNEGKRRGMYYHYSDEAILIEKGSYYTGKKQGAWINFVTKDTVTYNNGEIKAVSEKDLAREAKIKENKAKRKAKREAERKEKTAAKTKKKSETDKTNANKKVNSKGNSKTKTSNKSPKAKKDNFFKRLFSKKEKSNAKGQ